MFYNRKPINFEHASEHHGKTAIQLIGSVNSDPSLGELEGMQPNSASTPNGRKRKNLLRRALHRVAKFFGRHTAQKVATQVDLLPAAQDFFAVNSPVDVLPSLEIIVPLAVANDISPDGNAVETHAAELEDQFPHALGGIAENAIKAYNCGSSSNAPVGRSNTDQSIKETGGIQRNISTAFQFVMAAYGCNNFENVPAAEECLPLVEEISKLPDILAAERLDHDTKKECDHISKPEDIFERISPFSASGSEKLPDGDRESVVPDATILANTEIAEFADTAEVESDASDVRLIQRHVKMSVLKFEMGENQVSQKAESVSEDSQLNAENESVMQVDSALANTYIAGKADATGIECGTDSVPLTGQLIFQDIADTEEIESGSAEVQLMTIQQNFAKVVSNLIGGNEFSLTSPHIELIGTLSRSSFFKRHVSLARDKTTGYFRALKTYSKSALWSTEQGSQVLCDELASLRLVTEHWVPFCAKILGSFQTDSFICIVLPLYEGGCIVNHYRDMRFTHDQAKFYLAELALAIKALHDISILHRNINLNDILLDSSGHLKLSGFKHSQALPQRYEPMLVGSCGDERYIAPEMLRGQGYGQTVDWWAYGVVAYIMLVGRFPFNRSRECSLTDDILTTELEVTKESIMIEDMDIIATLLDKNPGTRLGSGIDRDAEIRQHGFFFTIDWERALKGELTPPRIQLPELPHDLEYNTV